MPQNLKNVVVLHHKFLEGILEFLQYLGIFLLHAILFLIGARL